MSTPPVVERRGAARECDAAQRRAAREVSSSVDERALFGFSSPFVTRLVVSYTDESGGLTRAFSHASGNARPLPYPSRRNSSSSCSSVGIDRGAEVIRAAYADECRHVAGASWNAFGQNLHSPSACS
jgi:hypothetical protein